MSGRGHFVRRRGHPVRWPLSALVAFMLLGLLWGTPRNWIDSFLGMRDGGRRTGPVDRRPWLVLVPPPEVEVQPGRDVPPPPVEPPTVALPPPADWWRSGLRVRIAEDRQPARRLTAADSARHLLLSLGLPADTAALARPDSQLARRLLLLQREDTFRFDALKPYFGAMTRARAYADLQSRVAHMYDDFLKQEIVVPD